MGATPQPVHIEPREFTFTWLENGRRKTTTLSAECYADACWMLGATMAARFLKMGAAPKDFELDLISQAPPHEATASQGSAL
jgi:hypothetical protein